KRGELRLGKSLTRERILGPT
ncbi:glucose / Sorbosone dehydrogenase family protein, partial [Vibrio parahaemolyticus V-223/04]